MSSRSITLSILSILVPLSAGRLAFAQCLQFEDRTIEPVSTESRQSMGYATAATDHWILVGSPDDAVAHAFHAAPAGGGAQELRPSNKDADFFGCSLAAESDVAVIGARGAQFDSVFDGRAFVYRLVNDAWVEEQELAPTVGSGYGFGHAVALSGAVVAVGYHLDSTTTYENGSVHIFRYDGSNWVLEQRIVSPDPAAGVQFGYSLALEGDSLLVGAPKAGDGGLAYLFHEAGGVWSLGEELTPPDGTKEIRFGESVALRGWMALVGAPFKRIGSIQSGAAYPFYFDGTNWIRERILTAGDGAEGDWFGSAVALSGQSAIVGAPLGDVDARVDLGSAYRFDRSNGHWFQARKYVASDAAVHDRGGFSLSIFRDHLVWSAPWADRTAVDSGVVHLFDLETEGLLLSSSPRTPVAGDTLTLTTCGGVPGSGVLLALTSIDGQPVFHPVALGAFDAHGQFVVAGTVPPELTGLTLGLQAFGAAEGDGIRESPPWTVDVLWTERAELVPISGSDFGSSLAQSGHGVLVGAPKWLAATGTVVAFGNQGGNWVEEQVLQPQDATYGARFGSSIAASGDLAVIGAPLHDLLSYQSGCAYVFRHDGVQWQEEAQLPPHDSQYAQYFGQGTAISGNFVFVGAPRRQATHLGSGAISVFEKQGASWVEVDMLLPKSSDYESFYGSRLAAHDRWLLVAGAFAVVVYEYDGAHWVEVQEFEERDQVGRSFAIQGGLAAIGYGWASRPLLDYAGMVDVLRFDGQRWRRVQRILSSDPQPHDYFGTSVAIDGDRLLIGAFGADLRQPSSGGVSLHEFDGTRFHQTRQYVLREGTELGNSVLLSGDLALASARSNRVVELDVR